MNEPRVRRPKGAGSLWWRASDSRWIGEITIRGERRIVSNRDRGAVEAQLDALADVGKAKRGEAWWDGMAGWRERPLHQYAAHWLDSLGTSVRPITLRGYTRILRLHIVPVIGHFILGTLDTRAAYEPIRVLTERGAAPSTIRNTRNVLHAMLRSAVREEAIDYNPSEELRVKPGELRGSSVRADVEHVQAVMAAVGAGDTIADLVRLGIYTGARLGELVAMEWNDISWEGPALRIERTATVDAEGRRTVGPTKTRRSKRTIPLSVPAVKLLRIRHTLAGTPRRGLVFPSRRSATVPIQPTWVTASFQKRLASAGLERMRFHDLRHIAALRLLGPAGMDPVTVAALLGHSSPAVAQTIYAAGIVTTRQREAVDALGALDTPQTLRRDNTPQS